MKKILVLLFILNAALVYAGDEIVNLSNYFEKDNTTTKYEVYGNDNIIEIKSKKDKRTLFLKCDDYYDYLNCNQFIFEIMKIGNISKWGEINTTITDLNLGYGNLNGKEKTDKLTGTLNNQTLLITGDKSKETISIPIIDLDVFRDLYVATVIASRMANVVNEMKESFDNVSKEIEKNINNAIDEFKNNYP